MEESCVTGQLLHGRELDEGEFEKAGPGERRGIYSPWSRHNCTMFTTVPNLMPKYRHGPGNPRSVVKNAGLTPRTTSQKIQEVDGKKKPDRKKVCIG